MALWEISWEAASGARDEQHDVDVVVLCEASREAAESGESFAPGCVEKAQGLQTEEDGNL